MGGQACPGQSCSGKSYRKIQNSTLLSLILNAIALAMGAVTAVLGLLKELSPDSGFTLLGIGLFCLALARLRDRG